MRTKDPNRKAKNIRSARTVIVAELFAKGYTFRQIQSEVMERMRLKSYSLQTVSKDIEFLKKEWREARIENMDDAVNSELYKINLQERELWAAWEKSKDDQKLTFKKQKGVAASGKSFGPGGKISDSERIVTTGIERTEKEEINYGDPRYQSEITKLGIERRKLIGMYAPEKREHTGNVGFFDFLQEVNTNDEE